MDESIVMVEVPVEALVSTAVTVAKPDTLAVKPAEPETVAVFSADMPAVEVNVRVLVPATVSAVRAPKERSPMSNYCWQS